MSKYDTMTDRELDAVVAEKVFGWRLSHRPGYGHIRKDSTVPPCKYPHYASDIEPAWHLVYSWRGDFELRRQNGMWKATFFIPSREFEAWADTGPRAVCLARLLATDALSPTPETPAP